MKFKSLFYNSEVNLKSISRSRLILALVLGLLSAFIIYSFLYVIGEGYRALAIGFDNTPQIISDDQRNYQNLFFSLLAMVFGNSIVFNYLFSRPQKITHRFNSKRKRLLNDNIFLSFNFSYWFAEIGLAFGVFWMCCLDFEFLGYFKEFSFLLIIVLYLESLKSFSFFLKNRDRIKFITIHAIFLFVFGYGMSKVEVLDYKKIDNIMVYNNPIIDLPKAAYFNDRDHYYNRIDLKLKLDSLNIIYLYNYQEQYTVYDFQSIIDDLRPEIKHQMVVNLNADYNCKVIDIKRFEKEMMMFGLRRISYAVNVKGIDTFKYEYFGILKKIGIGVLDIKNKIEIPYPPLPPFIFDEFSDVSIKDTVTINIDETIKFNGRITDFNKIGETFGKYYTEHTLFKYIYEESTTYQNYIDVYSAHIEFVEKLRKAEQKIPDNFKYRSPSDAFLDEQNKLKEKYPILILEKINLSTP